MGVFYSINNRLVDLLIFLYMIALFCVLGTNNVME